MFNPVQQELIYTLEKTKNLIIENYLKNNKFIIPREESKYADKILLNSIYQHTNKYKKFTLLMRCKIITNYLKKEDIECLVCGNENILFGYTIASYCGDKNCLKQIQSKKAKDRGMWMVHTKEAEEKKSKALTGRRLSEENKRKIGESNAKKWTEEYKAKDRLLRISKNCDKRISNTMKTKILAGEFTPKSENRKRAKRIKSEMTGLNYRSNWELIFHEDNPKLEYEKLRLSYMDGDKERVYITDFVDFNNKIIYEIKPSSELNEFNFLNKKKYAEEWCSKNAFLYKVVTEKEYNFYGRK
jgi:hypothetical protein